MLEAALARPSVREIMKLYGTRQEKDQGLDAYRSATRETSQVSTTNSSKRLVTRREARRPTILYASGWLRSGDVPPTLVSIGEEIMFLEIPFVQCQT